MQLSDIDWQNLNYLTIGLWTGLVVLTLALLILMLTRWGQAQPLSKCVLLSVFAHCLFIGYAYATKLLITVPPQPQEEVIRLALVDQSTSERPRQDPRQNPWERLAAPLTVQPRLEEPERLPPPLDRPAPVATSAEWNDAEVGLPTEVDYQPIVPRPVAALPAAAMPESPTPATQVAEAQAPAPVVEPNDNLVGPSGPPLERMRPLTAEEMTAPRNATTASLRDPGVDVGQRIQQLADVDLQAAAADATAGPEDRTQKAANEAQPEGSASLAATAISDLEDAGPKASAPTSAATPGDAVSPVNTLRQMLREREHETVRRLSDGQTIPPVYLLRIASQRRQIAQQLGANEQTEQAVEAALRWLAAHQEGDGSWDASRFLSGNETRVLGHDRRGAGADADTGVTGLSVLAFLAAGETHLDGPHRTHVQHGLEYLLRAQGSDGNLAGNARSFAAMYCHGMALLAISEAYALTGDHRLKPFVEQGVSYSVAAQNSTSGGWRYHPGDEGDMSQFGWQVMALKSAELAGIELPSRTRIGMLRFISSVSGGRQGALCSYRAGGLPTPTMTAEGLLCRYFLSLERSDAAVREASDMILSHLGESGPLNLYFYYYGSLAMFQVQGDAWRQWNQPVQKKLLDAQRRDGDLAGSWDPDTTWGGYGGRVYSTAMAALSLEVYYRYLPLLAEP